MDLNQKLARAELVCEALASLFSEENFFECITHYSVAYLLKERFDQWQQQMKLPG